MTSEVLRLESVGHSYGVGRPALRGVSLSVAPGERVGLVGPSGAGKSTLLRCVNGLVDPSEGVVTVLGRSVAELTGQERMHLRREIGMVFQEFALIDRLSVMTNVLVGRLGYCPVLPSLLRRFDQADRERARRALNEVGLAGTESRLVRALSGGQRQRVGIARAMVQEARLILGDEPTANLDVKTADDVLRLLVSLAEVHGVTLLMSLHDVRSARRFCTRVIALRDGEVAWDGAPGAFSDDIVEHVFYA